VNVHRLHLADVVYPDWHPNTGVGPVYGFAVVTDSGTVLVDTGIGPEQPLIDRLYQPTRHPLDRVLHDAGIESNSVIAIVNSHLHFDHCGGNAVFPGVPVWVQSAEREAAREPRYTIPEFVDDPAVHYRLIVGDAEVVPGVRVLSTPGHTSGHQCVAVDHEDGTELIATQAFETIAEFEAARADGSLAQRYPSLDRLMERVTTLHVSHDDRVWRRV
jgi:glyoxylase-like metal-dependent hydrolase (beta-lactamase superfamily II)